MTMYRAMTHTVMVGVALSVAATTSGCVPHSLESTEVGVRTVRLAFIGSTGVIGEPYSAGQTYFFPPLVNGWAVFDVGLQNLAMTRSAATGAREGDDALETGTEVYFDPTASTIEEFGIGGVDPSFKTEISFRFGGDMMECVAAEALAAAIAKLTSGIVYEDQEGVLKTVDEAIALAHANLAHALKDLQS